MKKILAMCLALGLTFGSVSLPTQQFSRIFNTDEVSAETTFEITDESLVYDDDGYNVYQCDGFWYLINNDGTASIIAYVGQDKTDLVIPSEIDGYKVRSVGSDYYYNRDFIDVDHFINVKNITISEGITEIGKSIFYSYDFESVILPNSLKKIDDYAFMECTINNITLPEGLEEIGSQAFYRANVQQFVLSGDIENVSEDSFIFALFEIATIENGVKDISNVFSSNTWVKQIYIPSSVTKVDVDFLKLYVSDFTELICVNGSYAETLARKNNLPFRNFDGKYIGDCEITLNKERYKPTEKPKVTIKDGDEVLTLNKDYVIRYITDSKMIIISGRGEYSGMSRVFYDTYTDISACSISLSKTSFTYTGNACKPKVIVKNKYGSTLEVKKDYNVRYVNNVNTGTATVVISGTGFYCGSTQITFTITE